MHRQSGQATVEWVALLLVAALILGAAATNSATEGDHGLGQLVAKRIAKGPQTLAAAAEAPAPPGAAAPPGARATAPRTIRAAPTPPDPRRRTRRADPLRHLRGIQGVARRAWLICLGYHRFRHQLERPLDLAATGALPLRDGLDIANGCLNPFSFLLPD